MKYRYFKSTPPFRFDINLIDCKGLSLRTIVDEHDINIVGAAMHVSVSPAGRINKEKLMIAPDL